MADLALQMTSWKTPIEDLINKYNQTNMWPLLEILTVFPEEVNSRLLRLGANRRNEVILELSSHSKIILEYLVSHTISETIYIISNNKFQFLESLSGSRLEQSSNVHENSEMLQVLDIHSGHHPG
jgi:Exportin 1-like protein